MISKHSILVCVSGLFALAHTLLPADAEKPTIVVLATGGTIANTGANRMIWTPSTGYLPFEERIQQIPEALELANFEIEQVVNVGSGGLNLGVWKTLAQKANDALARPEVAGVIVTHGTYYMEETCYFLNLYVTSDKPVVVVGANRRSTSMSEDGTLNFYNSTRLVLDPQSRGMGVMTCMNETIHPARDVKKANNYRLESFMSPMMGPLGYTDVDKVVFFREPMHRHTTKSEFVIDRASEHLKVGIVYGYAGASSAAVYAMAENGYDGVIIGGSSPALREAIQKLASEDFVIVQANRMGSGRQLAQPEWASSKAVTADSLIPQKARILLLAALSQTKDLSEIQRIFNEY